MPYKVPEASVELVKEVKVQIGKEWVAHSWGKGVPREIAMKRARQILEALA